MDTKVTQHNYGIDLLRIAAMFLIAAHHFSLHSGISFEDGSGNDILMQVLALGGKTGVNIFVLITGFYSSGRIRYGKIFSLIGCASLYSLILTGIALLTKTVAFSGKMLLKAAAPLLFGNTYWFVTTYLELYLLIPVLSMVSEKLNEKTYRNYLILFTVLLCILPKAVGKFIHVNDLGYNPLVWFVYLYFLGAYLRKFGVSGKMGGCLCIAVGCAAVQIVACVLLRRGIVGGWTGKLLECAADYSANGVFPLLISISMLLWFRSVKVCGCNTLVRRLGAATLGVYLFHDHANFRGWLWQNVFRAVNGRGLWPFAISAGLCILAVFVLGAAAELLRAGVAQWIRANFVRVKK